jgi:hypothetical protein
MGNEDAKWVCGAVAKGGRFDCRSFLGPLTSPFRTDLAGSSLRASYLPDQTNQRYIDKFPGDAYVGVSGRWLRSRDNSRVAIPHKPLYANKTWAIEPGSLMMPGLGIYLLTARFGSEPRT